MGGIALESHGDEAELRCGQNMLIVPSLLTESLIPKLLIMHGWVSAQHIVCSLSL